MAVAAQGVTCPVAHIDDVVGVDALLAALAALHGPEYGFGLGRWDGRARWTGVAQAAVCRFIMAAEAAWVIGEANARLRGLPDHGTWRTLSDGTVETTSAWEAELWPGDVVVLEPGRSLEVQGRGVYFEVTTELEGYPAPQAAFLRHLPDKPGGCASYAGAFRREALPPVRAAADAADQRGVNRVNEHTLDMRDDRVPPPSRHHHAAVPVSAGRSVAHSEIALVLPRSAYGLPEVAGAVDGRVVLYTCPELDPTQTVEVAVRPGSIVVTPATKTGVAGHYFANAFAMLVAVPGFVSPAQPIQDFAGK
jgi:hypothetical protein